MTERAAKVVFWVGTLASAGLFLGLTWDTQHRFDALTHADRLDHRVVAGKRAFERHNCNDCHTILGFGSYYAPDLTRVYQRVGALGIERRLRHPEKELATSFRKMPQQHLADQEVQDLVSYFAWVGQIENNDWPPQDSDRRWKLSTQRILAAAALSPGAALIDQEGCLNCHALGGAGAQDGPRFEWVGGRHSAAWIADYIARSAAVDPDTDMPSFEHLTPQQRTEIADLVVAVAASREESR